MHPPLSETPDLSLELAKIRDSYNKDPYQSFPFYHSNPAHLKTIGKLFGLEAAPLATARILELGCASGGNIIPFACQYPEARIVGVDLSEVQIEAGKTFISQLGLQNIELKTYAISDIDESFGQFDYIIAHGIFSWVPDFVREEILRICRDRMVSTGIAYISYNTLPGWHTRRIVRDMALYHSENFDNTKEKINQTKQLLQFVGDALNDSDDSYSKLIMESVNLLKDKPDYYIAHDFLEINNKPFYFSEFVNMIEGYGLKYMAEASVSTMFLGNYPEAIRTSLGKIKNIIRTEQYLDFIINRHFRSTLICHQTATVDRNLPATILHSFYIKMKVRVIQNPKLQPEFEFNGDPNSLLSTESPILQSLFLVASEHYNIYLSFDDWANLIVARMKNVSKEEVVSDMNLNLLSLFLSGKIKISADDIKVQNKETEYPKVWKYVAVQCKYLNISYVTNLYHEPVAISVFERFMIPYLDGTRNKEEILQRLLTHVQNKELDVNLEGKKVHTEDRLMNILSLAYIDAMECFVDNALLV